MANNKAFTYLLGPKHSAPDEDRSVHQSSPSWVLTFVRWEIRDTLRTGKIQTRNNVTQKTTDIDYTSVRKPLVVENDCLAVSTTDSKGVLTTSMSATLVQTDVNYETEIEPGDFMCVNMLNWDADARRVANQARASKAINGPFDGFKGIFKVQSVRKMLSTDPSTGTRMLLFKIDGFAFTEFNNTIYFNQALIDQSEKDNSLLFASNIGNNWALLVSNKGITNVQDLIKALIESFVGEGVSDSGRLDKLGTIKSPNVQFFIPQLVGSLLGIKGAKAAKDIYNYLFGIQAYSSGAVQTLANGMNPSGLNTIDGRFLLSPTQCQGDTIHKPEYWNQVKTWSILNQFTNAPLNELFTCFRLSPNGRVMPTLVFRQIPFTTEDFNAGGIPVTRFMNLPRWKIHPALVIDLDIGRDEAARVNFVQYFGRSTLGPDGYSISDEIAQHNYLYDIDDVKRSGLRPYIVTTLFDEPVQDKQQFRSAAWAKIVGDALIGGHLKMNGSMTCVGIVEPIAIGDNLEFDGIVYHIEQVTHAASINPGDGKRMFRTTLKLSSGLSKDSSADGTKYAEMTYADAYQLRNVDYQNNQILPGVSESQDVVYRPNNPDVPHSGGAPFVQPNTNTSVNKSQRGEKDKK